MILVESLPSEQTPEGPKEHIQMDWHQRQKHRQKCTTDAGTEIALALPRGTVLCNGTMIYNTPERTILVRSAQQNVIVVRAESALQACKIAHHMGNWHRSMHVLEDMTILLEADGPLQSWLDQAGIKYAVEGRADFQPNLYAHAHD
jgi:urease accessory protein